MLHQFGSSLAANTGLAIPVSVVVCTRNRPLSLAHCLESLTRLDYPNFEIIVVDNAPSDEPARPLAEKYGARYVLEPQPGVSRARNHGARAASGAIVAYLDDDATAEPGWLSALAAEFNDPAVVAVAGSILPARIETEAERLFAGGGGLDCGREWQKVGPDSPFWFERANFGGIGNASNMAFRASVFERWTGFDERLGRGRTLSSCAEHHAFFSLIESGGSIVYTPAAVVRHPLPATMAGLRAEHLALLQGSAAYMLFLFFEKPIYRGALLRYCVEAMAARRRTWRGTIQARPSPVSLWVKLGALLQAAPMYLRFRVEDSRRTRRTNQGFLGTAAGQVAAEDGVWPHSSGHRR